jgi:hypothetical protein
LSLHQPTLKLLQIEDSSGRLIFTRFPADEHPSLQTFRKGFSQLTTLALLSSAIFSALNLGLGIGDVLPPQLQRLQLQYDNPTDRT